MKAPLLPCTVSTVPYMTPPRSTCLASRLRRELGTQGRSDRRQEDLQPAACRSAVPVGQLLELGPVGRQLLQQVAQVAAGQVHVARDALLLRGGRQGIRVAQAITQAPAICKHATVLACHGNSSELAQGPLRCRGRLRHTLTPDELSDPQRPTPPCFPPSPLRPPVSLRMGPWCGARSSQVWHLQHPPAPKAPL